LGQAARQKDRLPFEINQGGSCSFFAIMSFMINLNMLQKTTAENGTARTEEEQTLLSKPRKIMQFKLNLARSYNELTLNNLRF